MIASAQSLREVHVEGKTREEIENALRVMPFVRGYFMIAIITIVKGELYVAPRDGPDAQEIEESGRHRYHAFHPLKFELGFHLNNTSGTIF